MKVKDIIDVCSPIWMPGKSYNEGTPSISVLLPTFRRSSDGLFRRALKSITSQSLENLEVIIVDDASTDGTSEVIQEIMSDDGRVSCIRHQYNMGLPAISEFEAFRKARAPVIGFAFDDFVYEPDSLGSLLNLMSLRHCEAIHGQGRMLAEGHDVLLGEVSFTHDNLLYHNFIANGAVLMSRSAIEVVGLYDPHIVLSRLCDWDLWLRLRRDYIFEAASVLVGREHGASRSDSLGNTYPMQFEVMQEFMGIDRNRILTPAKFSERDVLSIPDDASYSLRQNINELYEFFRGKKWFPKSFKNSGFVKNTMVQSRKTAVIVGSLTASVSLYWIGDTGSDLGHFTLLDPEAPDAFAKPVITRADLVVFVRELMSDGQQRILALCRSLKIPHVYFTDDNFPVLAQEDKRWAAYSSKNLQKELESFEGVIVSSQKLLENFHNIKLHRRIDKINPIFVESEYIKLKIIQNLKKRSEGKLHVGCFGGNFRHRSLIHKVRQALKGTGVSTKLFTRPISIDLSSTNIDHVSLAESPSFYHFLETWSKADISVIAHPAGHTANIDFKSENALLVSLYLGAVPIVPDEAAYADYGPEVGVEKVNDDVSSWAAAFERLSNHEYRSMMFIRLEQLCRHRFTPIAIESLIRSYLSDCSPLGCVELEQRYRRAMRVKSVDFSHQDHNESKGACPLNVNAVENRIASATPRTYEEYGFLDEVVSGHSIRGWAYSEPRKGSELLLRIDGFPVGTFSANLFRNDLLLNGLSNGSHAFLVALPEIFLDGERHSVSVSFLGSQQELAGSPLEVLLSGK